MAYTINKSDGTILATVADGQIDTLSSDITLVGKNYSGFGEALNENLIKILENFSNTSAPTHPIRGQIWFDVNELKLKVYSGTSFVPVSSATISGTQPINLGVGDLWFNDIDKQLYFYDGTNTILLGPDFSLSQGLSGLRVSNILDSLNQNRVITYLYTNGILLGIFSKDSFTPKLPINGFSGSIEPGFNASTLPGIKFNVTATNSDKLGNQPASSYVRNDTSNIVNGQIIISSNLGLIIGDANQGQFQVQDGNLILANIASNKNIILNVRRDVIAEPAIVIESAPRKISLYKDYSTSEIEIGGSLIVQGDLTVNGDVVSVNTSTVTVEDKNIVLAKQTGTTPSDSNAAGGGVILQGSSSHVLLWTNINQPAQPATAEALSEGYNDSLPQLFSGAWNSSEHLNLASGKEFKINGVTVLSATALGPGITSIPGVTSFGAQTQFTVDDIFMDGNTIQVTAPNTDLTLNINGSGTLNLGNKRISDLFAPRNKPLNPLDPDPGATDAANREYVDQKTERRSLAFSMDISDGIANSGIAALLEQIAPVTEYRNGTIARILCSLAVNGTTNLDINSVVSTSSTEFVTPSGTAFGLNNISFTSATIAAPGIGVSRTVKTFQITSGAWTFVS
jgi:hypothetical protein